MNKINKECLYPNSTVERRMHEYHPKFTITLRKEANLLILIKIFKNVNTALNYNVDGMYLH